MYWLPSGIRQAYNHGMGIGELVKQHRERLGWSQPQLARKAGISTAAVWRIEHGERLGRSDTIARLVKVLQIDPSAAQAAMEEAGYEWPAEEPPEEPTVDDLLRDARVQFQKVRPIRIPFIQQSAAAGYLGGAPAEIEMDYWPEPQHRNHKLLAIRVSGTCLEPRLMDGHTAIVDRNIDAKEGDIVLALHEGEAILKEYRMLDGVLHLVALQGQPPIRVNSETRIVGVVVDAKYKP